MGRSIDSCNAYFIPPTHTYSYAEVKLLKPKASRSESSETYVLARGFCRSSNTEGEEEAPGGGGGGAGGRDA